MRDSLDLMQDAVLSFLRDFMREHGAAPTLVEIAAAVGNGHKSQIHKIINRLVDRGEVRRIAGKRDRNLELVNPLARFTNDELIAELTCRGVSVPRPESANPRAGDGAACDLSHEEPPRQPVLNAVHGEVVTP